MAVCNLACEGLSGVSAVPDLAQRKLYIGGLSPEVTTEVLLNFFGRHGEIEEGSVAYDKDTNESRYNTIVVSDSLVCFLGNASSIGLFVFLYLGMLSLVCQASLFFFRFV